MRLHIVHANAVDTTPDVAPLLVLVLSLVLILSPEMIWRWRFLTSPEQLFRASLAAAPAYVASPAFLRCRPMIRARKAAGQSVARGKDLLMTCSLQHFVHQLPLQSAEHLHSRVPS